MEYTPRMIEIQGELMRATGGSSNTRAATAVMKALDWMRHNPRRAQELLDYDQSTPVEWSIRKKYSHKPVVVSGGQEAALRRAQEIADDTSHWVEVYQRAQPERHVKAFTVKPDHGR